jgi:hypothetical protein
LFYRPPARGRTPRHGIGVAIAVSEYGAEAAGVSTGAII